MKKQSAYDFKSAYILELFDLDNIQVFDLTKKPSRVILLSKDSGLPELINKYGAPPKLKNLKIGNLITGFSLNFYRTIMK